MKSKNCIDNSQLKTLNTELFDMLKSRNQEILTGYFKKMPNREKVRWVYSDIYHQFKKSIVTTMPNTQWVIDLFHVKLKDPEHKKEQNQLMLKRLFKYIDNNNLSLTYVALTDSPHVSGLTQPLMKLLVALGIEMAKYYSPCKQSVYTSLPG